MYLYSFDLNVFICLLVICNSFICTQKVLSHFIFLCLKYSLSAYCFSLNIVYGCSIFMLSNLSVFLFCFTLWVLGFMLDIDETGHVQGGMAIGSCWT